MQKYHICRVLSPDNTFLKILELCVLYSDGVVGTQHPSKKVGIC